MEMIDGKIGLFATALEADQRTEYLRRWPTAPLAMLDHYCTVKIVPGIKYTKINIGDSGKYMVENETGKIFGIKAYGVIHRGHQYGTLDTINEWWWGDYTARPKQVKQIT